MALFVTLRAGHEGVHGGPTSHLRMGGRSVRSAFIGSASLAAMVGVLLLAEAGAFTIEPPPPLAPLAASGGSGAEDTLAAAADDDFVLSVIDDNAAMDIAGLVACGQMIPTPPSALTASCVEQSVPPTGDSLAAAVSRERSPPPG